MIVHCLNIYVYSHITNLKSMQIKQSAMAVMFTNLQAHHLEYC